MNNPVLDRKPVTCCQYFFSFTPWLLKQKKITKRVWINERTQDKLIVVITLAKLIASARLVTYSRNSLFLVTPNHLYSSSLDSPACPCLSHRGKARTGHGTIDVASPVLSKGMDHLPWPAGKLQPPAAQDAISFFHANTGKCKKGIKSLYFLHGIQSARYFILLMIKMKH